MAGPLAIATFAPGCLLDYSGLSGGSAAAGPDASIDADASQGEDGATNDQDADPTDHSDMDGTDSTPDACSPLSCGACEPCVPPGCAPTTFATGAALAGQPRAIAFGPGSLVWATQGGGQIVRLADQPGEPEVLASADSPSAIAVSQDYVLWSEQEGVFACQSSSCEATRKKLDSSLALGSIRGVALDGATAYWTDRGASSSASGAVRTCTVESCASPSDVAQSDYMPQAIALSPDYLFWADQGDGFETGAVFMADKQGANAVDVAQALRLPSGLAADDSYVYFSRATSDGRVHRCAYLEGYCETPVDVAPAAGDLGHPFAVAVQGARIWFATSDDGAIRSCPAPGCGASAPTTHVSGRAGLTGFAVGSSCLFWTDTENGGSVMKIAW